MREIKFRAWDDLNKYMVYDDKGLTVGKILDRFDIVMQYTGLKDKNGVEIYEGDIVKRKWGDNIVVEYGIQEVDAFEGMGWNIWGFMESCDANGIRLSRECEVIGNIYENKELLECE